MTKEGVTGKDGKFTSRCTLYLGEKMYACVSQIAIYNDAKNYLYGVGY